MSRAYCRNCRRETPWMNAGSYNGVHPLVEVWRCRACGGERTQMADLPDADGLAHTVIDTWLRTTGNQRGNIDFEEALGHLRLHLWIEYRRWDPTRGVPFLAYATGLLRHRLTRWVQDNLTGRSGRPKAHIGAVSLSLAVADGDEWDPLDSFEAALQSDPAEDCSPDLGGVLTRRSREDAWEERRLGIGPDARAAEGDQTAPV